MSGFDPRDSLHEEVDAICDTHGDIMHKWSKTMAEAEAIIVSQDESEEQKVALQRLRECAFWFTLAITGTGVMDRDEAKRTVRRMR